MLKFIFNFIFFGILFYVIWQFFPDAFNTLVSWAGHVVDFIVAVVQSIVNAIGDLGSQKPAG